MSRAELIAVLVVAGLIGTWGTATWWDGRQARKRIECFDQPIARWGECKPPGTVEILIRRFNSYLP